MNIHRRTESFSTAGGVRTRTGTSTPERSPKIQPSTLLGDAGREPLLPSVPVMPTSLCQIIPYPLVQNPTTTLLTMLLHRNV